MLPGTTTFADMYSFMPELLWLSKKLAYVLAFRGLIGTGPGGEQGLLEGRTG